jgi:uncharacterized protein (DUF305 family)
MKLTRLCATAILGCALAAPVLAQQMPMPHAGMTMPAKGDPESPSTKAFKEANDRMMQRMGESFTGKADADFVSGMIPHHQGAVDMARIELQYGTDPELRALAQDIIAAQQKEIAFMVGWQEKHGIKPKP